MCPLHARFVRSLFARYLISKLPNIGNGNWFPFPLLDILSLSYLIVGIGIPTLTHSIYYSSYTWKAVRNMPPLAITSIGCTLGESPKMLSLFRLPTLQ